jgi:hypothetical protein
MLESNTQKRIRLRLSALRTNLFLRYNVGTFLTMDGRPVKIGEPGVSDLIGVVSHVIRPEDVGKTVGVFVAMETKKEGRDTTSKERRESQGNFLARVRALGGIAGIVRSEEEALALVEKRLQGQ